MLLLLSVLQDVPTLKNRVRDPSNFKLSPLTFSLFFYEMFCIMLFLIRYHSE
jgi:hypothetical protein